VNHGDGALLATRAVLEHYVPVTTLSYIGLDGSLVTQ